jgi:hypothetical protein
MAGFDYDVVIIGSGFGGRPGDTKDTSPQANDAKCGFSCHTIMKNSDFVFTDYGPR